MLGTKPKNELFPIKETKRALIRPGLSFFFMSCVVSFLYSKCFIQRMIIRKAKKKDIESIQKLDRESTMYHKKFDKDFYTISEKWRKIKKDSQIKVIKSPTNLILVAEIDEKVVGYIWGYEEKILNHKIGKIQELIVTLKQRGKGIGTELIKKMLDFFKERKCIISEIEVFVENLPTIQVYEKAGFRKREYKMQLKLDKTKKFKPFF